MTIERMEEEKKKIIKEQIEILRTEMEKKFRWTDGENPKDFEYDLRVELKEFIESRFDSITKDVNDEIGRKEEITVSKLNGESEFKNAVLTTVLPWAIEHTECFKSEKIALENIETILKYSPDSISIVVENIDNKLDENIVKSILEKHPEFKEYIPEEIRNSEEASSGITAEFDELNKKLESLIAELNQGSGEGKIGEGIRKGLENVLSGYMGLKTRFAERDQINDKGVPSLE